ncbi:MAG: adenosylcobinamide-phosphate synthase CbiB [Clostridia bacterium]|nr:adenosylcobinamide-phosphate synthase CbiB [Clostridia bacterium]
MYLLFSTGALAAGYLMDLLIGDPQGWPHLVRGFGALIAALEKRLYACRNRRLGGALLALTVLLLCAGVPAIGLYAAWRLSPWLYFALESLLVWQLLSVRSLETESRRVYDALKRGDLDGARKALSMIVGRDTAALDEAGVARAAIETVAENTSDGVAAPLFFMLPGGASLGCFYKAANTMDSMIGYKNARYKDFGRFAARLDDALNFLPARLCALTMLLAVRLCRLDAKNALRIWRRDRLKHASPNAGQTEAVMAGALGLRLAGDAYYFGELSKKPFIGDALRPVEPEDILRAHRVLRWTAWLWLFFILLIRGCAYAAL